MLRPDGTESNTAAFLELFVPSADNIKHDHSYSKGFPTAGCQVVMSTQSHKMEGVESTDLPCFILDSESLLQCATTKETFNVSIED